MMNAKHFGIPVRIRLGRARIAYRVSTMRQAADILRNCWPIPGGLKQGAAAKACSFLSIGGNRLCPLGRTAFIAAATEAGILLA